jgi:hypothetical protein
MTEHRNFGPFTETSLTPPTPSMILSITRSDQCSIVAGGVKIVGTIFKATEANRIHFALKTSAARPPGT